jgi:hypothetical protein
LKIIAGTPFIFGNIKRKLLFGYSLILDSVNTHGKRKRFKRKLFPAIQRIERAGITDYITQLGKSA